MALSPAGRVCFCALLAGFVVALPNAAHGHVNLLAPNGDEVLAADDVFTVRWQIAISHNLQNWDLWYSTTGSGGPWIPIAMNLAAGSPAVGSIHTFNWTIPDDPSTQVRVRVRMDNSGIDYEDISNGNSTIEGIPVLSAPPLSFSEAPFGTSGCMNDGECTNTTTCVPGPDGSFPGTCYVRKNRALSTAANPDNAGILTARALRVVSSDLGACPTGACLVGFFDTPAPAPGLGGVLVSRLSGDPVFLDWTTVGAPVHFIDCVIQPGRVYQILSTTDDLVFSTPLTLPTVSTFGDTAGGVVDGVVQPPQDVANLADAQRVVKGFQEANTEPSTWLEILPTTTPNLVINLVDASAIVRAFQGASYSSEAGAVGTPCECFNFHTFGPCVP